MTVQKTVLVLMEMSEKLFQEAEEGPEMTVGAKLHGAGEEGRRGRERGIEREREVLREGRMSIDGKGKQWETTSKL